MVKYTLLWGLRHAVSQGEPGAEERLKTFLSQRRERKRRFRARKRKAKASSSSSSSGSASADAVPAGKRTHLARKAKAKAKAPSAWGGDGQPTMSWLRSVPMTGATMLGVADRRVEVAPLQLTAVKGGTGAIGGHVIRFRADDGQLVDQFHLKASAHGLGLFAARPLAADTVVSAYAGTEVTASEASATYTFQRKSGRRVDASEARLRGNVLFGAHFLNCDLAEFNCHITRKGEHGWQNTMKEGRVCTVRDIDEGEELLLHYGAGYAI